MRLLLLAVFFAMPATASIQAAIFERDFLTSGDGLLTYDDVNQREWLDLPYAFTNLENIQSEMRPGGLLKDFRFAREDDVLALHISAGTSDYHPDGIDDLIDKLGFIFRGQGGIFLIAESTYGLVAVDFADGKPVFDGTAVSLENVGGTIPPGGLNINIHSHGGRRLSVTSPDERANNNWRLPDGYFFLDGSLSLDTGPFWLYREAVPEPTSTMLFSFAVAILSSTRLGRCVRS